MFCARCWSPTGSHDRVCPHCRFDLTRPGSVRLTDPRRVPRDASGTPLLHGSLSAAEAVAPPPVPSPQPAQPVASPPPAFDAPAPTPAQPVAAQPPAGKMQPTTGPGWWHNAKAGLVEIGEKAAAANQRRQQSQPPDQPAAQLAAEDDPGRTVLRRPASEDDDDRTVLRKPAAEPDPDRTVLRKPEPGPSAAAAAVERVTGPDEVGSSARKKSKGKKAGSSRPSADVDRAGFHKPVDTPPRPQPTPPPSARTPVPSAPPARPRPTDPDRTRRRPRSQPTPAEDFVDRTARAPHREPGELSLWDDYGMADAPTGFKFDPNASRGEQFNQALGASAMPTAKVTGFIAVLVGTLIVLAFLVGRLINMDAFVGQPSPTAPSLSSAEGTPAMQAGAQQCSEVVWAGEQTSCALAIELASQVPLDLTGVEVIEVHSASQGTSMQLQCTADQGISCQGLGDAQHLLIWLVA